MESNLQNSAAVILEPTRVLRRKELSKFTGYERSALFYLMKNDPTFPKPIKLGDSPHARRAWLASEIAAWQQKKIKERDAQF